MTLNEYQEQAMTTCMATSNSFTYMMLNLMGEVGEFASKVAKGIRKNFLLMTGKGSYIHLAETPEGFDEDLKKEAGDILWQLAGLCSVHGWTLEEIAQMNLAKLASRKERGKIDGDGDNR